MTPLPKYELLTPKQKAVILNGCGKKGAWFKPPDWFMLAECNHHDYGYYKGCTEADRKRCDDTFYNEMKRDVSRAAWYLKPARYAAAYIYYKAVRLFGKSAFYYADKPRTLEDLQQEVLMSKKRYIG